MSLSFVLNEPLSCQKIALFCVVMGVYFVSFFLEHPVELGGTYGTTEILVSIYFDYSYIFFGSNNWVHYWQDDIIIYFYRPKILLTARYNITAAIHMVVT